MANLLTGLRIALAPFAYLAGFAEQRLLFAAIFAIGGITDILDGLFARWLKQKSDFGSMLDTIADVVFYPSALTLMFFVPEIKAYWEVVALMIGLLGIEIVCCWLSGALGMPHFISAKSTAVATYTFVLYTLFIGFSEIMLYIIVGLGVYAALDKMIACWRRA